VDKPTRETALVIALAELEGCYLRLQCPPQAGCSKVSELPITTLVRRYGGAKTLAELVPRLQCRSCRSRAGQVELYGPRVTPSHSYAPPESAWHVALRTNGE
jgi:hypothetical protein